MVNLNSSNRVSVIDLFEYKEYELISMIGFWSVSIYGADQYLIRNPLNRFEVGERSYNLTYQNTGKLVYGPSADAKSDGPFQVLIQNVNATPPANWTGNWLPGSSSFTIISTSLLFCLILRNHSWDRPFWKTEELTICVRVIARFYAPQDSIFNGSYIFPKISTIPSIR